MDISKHIHTLVKFHECVIIPDFGGFISNYKPAVYNPASHSFSPPSKEIVFNKKITKNDGLLINYLVESENISYNEAHRVVVSFVENTQKKLNKGQTIEWEELGSLKLDRTGSLEFTPSKNIELIEAYGLKEFTYLPVNAVHQVPSFHKTAAVRALQYRGNSIKIAASVALLLSLSLFPVRNDKVQFSSSALNPVSVLLDNEPAKTEITEEKITPETAVEKQLPSPYILIGGNFQLEVNAKKFKEELVQKGHQPEIIPLSNGNFRVSINGYSDYQEAVWAMEEYRKNNPGSQVWVSKR
jgi:nucleoid DNA-binding protein